MSMNKFFLEYELSLGVTSIRVHYRTVAFVDVVREGARLYLVVEVSEDPTSPRPPEQAYTIFTAESKSYIPIDAEHIKSIALSNGRLVHFCVRKGLKMFEDEAVVNIPVSELRRMPPPPKEEELISRMKLISRMRKKP